MKSYYLLIILFLLVACNREEKNNDQNNAPVYYDDSEFVMGVDLSYVNQILDFGAVYSDSGIVEDPYKIFKKYGANVVRLRLFHNPQWTKECYTPNLDHMYNDFDDVKRAIKASKDQGLAVCLDFHYSDSWADPSKQVPPAAWTGLSLTLLHDSIYNYTFRTLSKLAAEGLMPEYLQAGNEINPGFLLPQGDRWNKKADFIYLLNGAIKAVRDASASSSIKPKIIIHVAQPENAITWFEGMTTAGLTDYDIAGISYYYMWSNVLIDNLSNNIAQIKTMTGKDVMVTETAYPWSIQNCDSYNNIIQTGKINGSRFPATQEGQLDYLKKLTQEIVDGGGNGIMYWEPAWMTSSVRDLWGTGSAWDCNTLFDCDGNVIKGMQFMTYKYVFPSK